MSKLQNIIKQNKFSIGQKQISVVANYASQNTEININIEDSKNIELQSLVQRKKYQQMKQQQYKKEEFLNDLQDSSQEKLNQNQNYFNQKINKLNLKYDHVENYIEIITALKQKIQNMETQYNQLLRQKKEKQTIQKTKINAQENQKQSLAKNEKNIDQLKQKCIKRFSFKKVFQYQISNKQMQFKQFPFQKLIQFNPSNINQCFLSNKLNSQIHQNFNESKNQNIKNEGQKGMNKNKQTQEQLIDKKGGQMGNDGLIRHFSSGEVQNLFGQENSLQEIGSLKQYQNLQNLNKNLPKLSFNRNIPLPLDSTYLINHKAKIQIISKSQINLSILKQSSDDLPYCKIHQIMNLQSFLNKISFKPKHYPNDLSNEKELKLYGKRIFRVLHLNNLLDQYLTQSEHNVQALQNKILYEKNQNFIVYYLKQNKNFVFMCYYNHTIYLGQYITHGPNQNIIRQGYGIQIRQNKYIYQGEFFADKKHGYGFINFLGKTASIYLGYFLDGFLDGYGKQMNEKGQIYKGEYKIGQKDGFGKLIYNNEKNIYYEGQFYDGKKHGRGFEMFENGDSYLGNYVNDKFQGEGEYRWKNGTIFKGTFLQGVKHGKGDMIFRNGKSFEKIYDHNMELKADNSDDKKTIKSSRVSEYDHNKIEEKTIIQFKPKRMRSSSNQSLFSNLSKKSKQKKIKTVIQKNKVLQLLKQKQIQEDLQNLHIILKQAKQQDMQSGQKRKRIFSVTKLQSQNNILGRMYNTIQKPNLKQNQKQLDLIKLSKSNRKKSLINFTQNEKLQQFKEVQTFKRIHRSSNFSQF